MGGGLGLSSILNHITILILLSLWRNTRSTFEIRSCLNISQSLKQSLSIDWWSAVRLWWCVWHWYECSRYSDVSWGFTHIGVAAGLKISSSVSLPLVCNALFMSQHHLYSNSTHLSPADRTGNTVQLLLDPNTHRWPHDSLWFSRNVCFSRHWSFLYQVLFWSPLARQLPQWLCVVVLVKTLASNEGQYQNHGQLFSQRLFSCALNLITY